jgi:phospholipid/cholesterol/gamma-HCH transport system substrate-binding protein
MEAEARYTLVGAAVLILIALLGVAVVWLQGSGEGANAERYKIYLEHQSLEGLELRSYVTMRGIRVGSVTGFRFSSRRPGAVEVFIAVDPSTPVRASTRATVDRNFVTGIASIRLVNTTEKSPRLTEAPTNEPYPVIAEGESPTERVTETLSQLAEQAAEALERIQDTLSHKNRAALAETLGNLQRVSKQAEGTLAHLDSAADSLGGAADEVRKLAAEVRDHARTLSARYDGLGADASVSVRDMGEAARKLSAEVERLSRRADALLSHGDAELRRTSRSLRSAADSVGSAADSVDSAAQRLRNPQGVIYGPAEGGYGPGEGAPQ